MSPGTVAITFDDGPHPDGTIAVLDQLDRLGWSATFFVLGSQALRHPAVLREVVRRGHEVGVHGFDHRYLIARTPRAAVADLRHAVDVVGTIAGAAPCWWRPPYGVLSGPSLLAAWRGGLRPVLWSAWGRDWEAAASPESIRRRVLAGRLDGGTVLLHDSDLMSAEGSWQRTVAALPLIAEHIDALGVKVAPLPGAD
jgi:peptidoglycan/xylan/chitin deacetylase (PgdA/CDA1 family)